MANDYEIIINNYVDKYYEMYIDEIKLNNSNQIDEDSFCVKSTLDDSTYRKGQLINEINTIFGDSEDLSFYNVPNKLINDWYNKHLEVKINELSSITNSVKQYFIDNLHLTLGPRNWETRDRDGNIFLLQKAITHFNEEGYDVINKKIVRHFYEIWYDNEVIITSEKLMGI